MRTTNTKERLLKAALDLFSEKGYANAAAVTTVGSTGPFTVVFAGGTNTTNSPKYYDSGTAVRMYAGNTLTVSSSMDIVGIEFEFDSNNNNLTTSTGTYSDTKWSGKAKSIVFTSTEGQSRIQKMTISYINDGSYTPPTVSDISVEDYTATFTESATATYSFDGKVYAVYSDESKVELSADAYSITGTVDMTTPDDYTLTVSATIGGTEYSKQIIITVEEDEGGSLFSYTLSAIKGTNNTAYATYYDVTVNNVKWNAPGNQNFDGYWRIGGNSITNQDRVIYGKDSLSGDVDEIVINTNGVSNTALTVNSITVTAHSTATLAASEDDASKIVFTTTDNLTFQKGTEKSITFTKSGDHDLTGYYYRIVFNITKSTSGNAGLDLTSIVFSEN